MKLPLIVFILLASAPAHALDVDVSAISATNTRQVSARGEHLFTGKLADLDLSGRYLKARGRNDQYDAGAAVAVKISGLRLGTDFREFHTHRTASGSIGTGLGAVTMGVGMRFDYEKPDFTRDDALIANVSLRQAWPAFNVSVSAEYLRFDENTTRVDYRARVGAAITDRIGVFVAADRLRGQEVQALGLAMRF